MVAIWAPNVPPWAGISLAAMRAGAAVSGIHPTATVDEARKQLVLDRLKELIKVNALQVAPAELEALLLTHPGVADAAVVPRPDERAGQVPVAVVVPDGDLDEGELIDWVADRVAPHKRIRAVRLVDAIPRTPAGKILRRRLVEAGAYGTTSMRVSGGGVIAAPVSDGAM